MTLVFMGNHNTPTYTALTTDIISNSIVGASVIGGTIFLTDSAEWYIIKTNLELAEYVLPVTISLAGNIEIGSVSIDQQLSQSVALAPYYAVKSSTTPGTPVQILASSTPVVAVTIMPKVGNAGTVYIGTVDVDKDTSQQLIITNSSPGVSIDMPLGYTLNMNTLYLDVVNSGDGVRFIYFK